MYDEKLTDIKEWKELKIHYNEIKKHHLRELFKYDKERSKIFSIYNEDIYFDYSKNLITSKTINLLLKLANSRQLKHEIERMFNGEKINKTENRPVLHIALRNMDKKPIFIDGKDIMPEVFSVIEKMRNLSIKIRNGKWKGFSNKKIKYIVNIGIGGSDLGPKMVVKALKYYSKRSIKIFFVSNIDSNHISETLREIEPEKTLFIISSKTFSTLETKTNANTAKNWILSHYKSKRSIPFHFIALSTNTKAAIDFGIDSKNVFEFWDWVAGRYSLTSAIGLSIMISIGYNNFIELLKGFHSMDNHFRNTPFEKNIPVIMALIGIWYNNFFEAETHAIIPYSQYLNKFPAFLQQCDMESNGKYIDKDGNEIEYQTGPIIWGEPGTNGQHAFFQLIHQGTKLIPCDFIGFLEPLNNLGDHHKKLIANFFAQTRALAFGKTREELLKEKTPLELIPFKICKGNKPTNTILIKKLTPFSLGRLIAMYEHKIFVQGIIWNIFSFDQWGVELGKTLSNKILAELEDSYNNLLKHDSSTNDLIDIFNKGFPQ
jgi:glucose-6-phosphate isomerase